MANFKNSSYFPLCPCFVYLSYCFPERGKLGETREGKIREMRGIARRGSKGK